MALARAARISGLVGFDGALDYAVSATLPPEVLGRGGVQGALAAGLLSDDRGRLLLDLGGLDALHGRLLGAQPLLSLHAG